MERKSIGVSKKTWEELRDWKSPGQSFDGAITELLDSNKAKVKQ